MDCLKDRDVIAQLFRMMAEHGRAEQLRELTRLIAAVDSMEQQFQVLQAELREVKKVQEMEVPAAGIGERLRAVRDYIRAGQCRFRAGCSRPVGSGAG